MRRAAGRAGALRFSLIKDSLREDREKRKGKDMRQHVLKIAENSRREIAETTPRYDVFLNGNVVGELYYNMWGYNGTLPTVHGHGMILSEAAVSRIKSTVASINRGAKRALAEAVSDPRKVTSHVPTDDSRYVYALSFMKGDAPEAHLISRREMIRAREMFGADPIGLGFFLQEEITADSPAALLEKNFSWVAEEIPALKAREMTPGEFLEHTAMIEDHDVHKTADPDTLLVIGRESPEDEYPDIAYVSRVSYEVAKASFGKHLRLIDLRKAEPAPVEDLRSLAVLRAEFPDEDFLLEGDAAERHEREQAAISEGYRMEKEQGAPLDAAQRHDVEQMKLTGVPATEHELPARGDTPEEDLGILNAWVREAGGYVSVDFEANDDEENLSARHSVGRMTPEIEARFAALSRVLIAETVEKWNEGEGSIGTLTFQGREEPWLNADAIESDWSHESYIEEVDMMEWPEEPDDSPSPS